MISASVSVDGGTPLVVEVDLVEDEVLVISRDGWTTTLTDFSQLAYEEKEEPKKKGKKKS